MIKKDTKRDAEIILLMVIGLSYKEIGDKYGISKTRIFQIQRRNQETHDFFMKFRAENLEKLMAMYLKMTKHLTKV